MNERFWVCDNCHSLNDLRHKRCYRCHADRSKASTSELGEGPEPPRDPALFTAVIAGLIAAVAAVYLWTIVEPGISLYQERFAGIVGVIIAVAVVVGGRGRVSLGSVIISVLLTVLTVFVGEYLIASAEIAPAGLEGRIPIGDPTDVADHVIGRFTSDPLRPILWVIAVFEGLAVPWAALVGQPVASRGAFRRRQRRGDEDDD
jgi:hypothetical protein